MSDTKGLLFLEPVNFNYYFMLCKTYYRYSGVYVLQHYLSRQHIIVRPDNVPLSARTTYHCPLGQHIIVRPDNTSLSARTTYHCPPEQRIIVRPDNTVLSVQISRRCTINLRHLTYYTYIYETSRKKQDKGCDLLFPSKFAT
jgi:hypothetical protein